MLTIGYGIRGSFDKRTFLDIDTGRVAASGSYPENEMPMIPANQGRQSRSEMNDGIRRKFSENIHPGL
ncbi:MAG: hypothetical protein NTV54_08635 [Ignavibacteriales bacterium]|nr:hypothetical protein [Ignavibacteriales bacterium]